MEKARLLNLAQRVGTAARNGGFAVGLLAVPVPGGPAAIHHAAEAATPITGVATHATARVEIVPISGALPKALECGTQLHPKRNVTIVHCDTPRAFVRFQRIGNGELKVTEFATNWRAGATLNPGQAALVTAPNGEVTELIDPRRGEGPPAADQLNRHPRNAVPVGRSGAFVPPSMT